jgi:hypothetical protein
MEDLKQFKEMHGHVNVSIPEEKFPRPILRQGEVRC